MVKAQKITGSMKILILEDIVRRTLKAQKGI